MKTEDERIAFGTASGSETGPMLTISTLLSKKAAVAAVAALALGAGMTVNASEAEARFGRKGLIAAGVIGALATAAIVASSRHSHADDGHRGHPGYAPVFDETPESVYYGHGGHGYRPHYEHRPYYNQPPQHYRHRNRHAGYSETGFAYRGPACRLKKQQVWTGYGWEIQRVEVCR
ncbi:hypothetical protein MCEMSEM23_00817 [Rhabdaerophilaceae bacterium]